MKIGIQNIKGSFSERWIDYCDLKKIDYKLVNCYKSDIIAQLTDCDAFMWHFNHASSKDVKFAKQLLYSLQAAGKIVFPDFNTMWHFDDKVGQKYLLEAVGAPLVPSFVFYTKKEAMEWVKQSTFPKVFKLRSGAGSMNVRLVNSIRKAIRLIKKAFGHGFSQNDPIGGLKERYRRFRLKKANWLDILKGIVRFIYPTDFARMAGREKGYVYFQDYIPGNDHDIRVIVVGSRAFAIKRLVRKNDFRASGSGLILYEKECFRDTEIKKTFELAEKLKSDSLAVDYVFRNGQSFILEISYGFIKEVYDPCTGYWDKDIKWHPGKFNPYGWMVEDVISKVKRSVHFV